MMCCLSQYFRCRNKSKQQHQQLSSQPPCLHSQLGGCFDVVSLDIYPDKQVQRCNAARGSYNQAWPGCVAQHLRCFAWPCKGCARVGEQLPAAVKESALLPFQITFWASFTCHLGPGTRLSSHYFDFSALRNRETSWKWLKSRVALFTFDATTMPPKAAVKLHLWKLRCVQSTPYNSTSKPPSLKDSSKEAAMLAQSCLKLPPFHNSFCRRSSSHLHLATTCNVAQRAARSLQILESELRTEACSDQ